MSLTEGSEGSRHELGGGGLRHADTNARPLTAFSQAVLGAGLVIGWFGFHVRMPEHGVRIRQP